MNKPSILIVDDERKLLKSMTALFRDDYNVFTAINGEKGLAVLEKEFVEVAIIDLEMPVMSGIEMVEQVRAYGNEVKVVILTGRGNYDYAKQCANMHVHGFLEKPSEPDELANILRNLTGLHEFKGLRELWGDEYSEKLLTLDAVVLKVLEYIEGKTRKSITCAEVALRVNMTPDYLAKVFKNSCGISLKEYISFSKVLLCKKLLIEDRKTPISKIAVLVGIKDLSYFCKFFKDHTGMTPREFRMKAQV